ncbi:MAG: hypothetical protein NTZ05_21505, partial [Chloroflexi bacterium]|nr:hypothetical protein [Chloroflexota bacterium]
MREPSGPMEPMPPYWAAAVAAVQVPPAASEGVTLPYAAMLAEIAAAGRLSDPDAPAQTAAEGARRLLNGRAALALVADASGRPRIAAPQSLPAPLRRLAQRLPARILAQADTCIETHDPAPAQVWPPTGRRLSLLLQELGCAALATVPVRGPAGPLALLAIGLERYESPNQEQQDALAALAEQTAAAMIQAQDGAARRLQGLRLELVAQVSHALSSTPDPLDAARRSVDLMRTLTPFGLLLLITLDESRRRMKVTPLYPSALPPLLPSSLPADAEDSAAGSDLPVWMDLRRRSTELDAALWDVGMRTGVRAPLQAHGRRVGMLLALQQRRSRPSAADMALLQDMARLLAPAIESHQLQERAADTQRELRHITSSLVIANQRLHDLTQQLEAAAREQQEFSRETVLMLATAAEAKDQLTGDHLRRVQHLSVALARRLRLPTGYVAE